MNLFAYGTLMWPDVLESVIGRRLEGSPSTLRGYVRLRVKGEHYPVIVPSADEVVEGVLYEGLIDADFRHLDRFEGEEYDRTYVPTDDADAHVYVLSEEWRHIAELQPWQPEQLSPEQLAAFRSEYKGWNKI